jgi:hypothetical protein
MTPLEVERIIALDIRPQAIGFVVFEGMERLLDWGVKRFPQDGPSRAPAGIKIKALIAAYVPDALVIKRPSRSSDRILSELVEAARDQGLVIHSLVPRAVRTVFPGCRNKDQVAASISERFPALQWNLPPKRKIWNSEDYRMNIFDAAAIGITYFVYKQLANKVPLPPI